MPPSEEPRLLRVKAWNAIDKETSRPVIELDKTMTAEEYERDVAGRYKYDLVRPKGPSFRAPLPLLPVLYATPADTESLLAFMMRMRDEAEIDGSADEAIARGVWRLTHRDGGVALIVRGTDGLIEGSIGIVAECSILAQQHVLRGAWYAVLPEARNNSHARSLLTAALAFADAVGRPLLIDALSPEPDHPKRKLFKRHFSEAGAVFRHVPVVA